MVKTKDEIKLVIDALIKEVSKDYQITNAVLFGSYAAGTATEKSDVDVALVSPDFRGKPEMEILRYLSRKAMKVDTSLEVVAFTPDELVAPDPRSFSFQVKSCGVFL